MSAPYDNEPGHRGEDPHPPDDAYTRDAYLGNRDGADDPYLGVDGPAPQFPAPSYDPRAGGYTTAQFVAGQFTEAGPAAPAPGPQAPGPGPQAAYDPNQVYDQEQPYAQGPAYPPPQGDPRAYDGFFDQAQPQPAPYYPPQGAAAPPPGMSAGPGPAQPGMPPAPWPGGQPGGPPPAAYPAAGPQPGAPGAPGEPPAAPQPAAPEKPAGKVAGLMKSSALMAAGTLVSRALGFVRQLIVAAAIGVGVLGDTYADANTLPTLLYILIGGGAINAVFVPQLVRSMKNDDDGGEAYANRLLTLVMTVMAAFTIIFVFAAPLLVHLIANKMTHDPNNYAVTTAFIRYCMPTIFFMGVHVVLGQVLNARNRFGAMMWTPVLNNVIIIVTFGLFLWIYGPFRSTGMTPATIPPAGIRLLGIGTLLGLVVQSLAMIPYVRDSGLKFRLRFDWRGHGLGHAARLARWTFLYVLVNQAGLIVTSQLANAAGADAASHGHDGTGWAAYQNALQIWQLPQSVLTVSLMTAVLPRISRAAADNDHAAVRDDISYGLRTTAVAIVPFAFLFLALGPEIGGLLFGGGVGASASHSLGTILMAFSLGLIPYSAQYVLLRGFYAFEDTKTPFYNTVWIAASTAALSLIAFFVLPKQFAVAGMAAGYGIAYIVGVAVAAKRLKKRLGGLDGARVRTTYLRLVGACIPAAVVSYVIGRVVTGAMDDSWASTLISVVIGALVFLALFFAAAKVLKVQEMTALVGAVRSKLGR